jgi:hypothetical protein
MADHSLPIDEFRRKTRESLESLIAMHPERWAADYVREQKDLIAAADRQTLYRIHQSNLAAIELEGRANG